MTQGFGLKNLDAELHRVKAAVLKEDWTAACRVLEPLVQQYPQEKKVWEYLTDVSFEAGNKKLYQKACEGLFTAASTGENAYMLGGAYLKNMHPLMAFQSQSCRCMGWLDQKAGRAQLSGGRRRYGGSLATSPSG